MHTPKEHAAIRAEQNARLENLRRENRRHRRELVVFGGVIALASILGSLIEASWIERPW